MVKPTLGRSKHREKLYARGPRGRFWSELITSGITPTSENFSHLAEGMSIVLLVALGSDSNSVVRVCL